MPGEARARQPYFATAGTRFVLEAFALSAAISVGWALLLSLSRRPRKCATPAISIRNGAISLLRRTSFAPRASFWSRPPLAPRQAPAWYFRSSAALTLRPQSRRARWRSQATPCRLSSTCRRQLGLLRRSAGPEHKIMLRGRSLLTCRAPARATASRSRARRRRHRPALQLWLRRRRQPAANRQPIWRRRRA